MMINQTLSKLTEMRLSSMEDEFIRQMELPAMSALPFEERFGLMVEAEWRHRYNAKIERLLKAAKLRCSSACLMEIAEDRENSGVMIITAQLPVLEWHEVFDDKTVADATLDRIVHGSYRIELRGPSRRARFNDTKISKKNSKSETSS